MRIQLTKSTMQSFRCFSYHVRSTYEQNKPKCSEIFGMDSVIIGNNLYKYRGKSYFQLKHIELYSTTNIKIAPHKSLLEKQVNRITSYKRKQDEQFGKMSLWTKVLRIHTATWLVIISSLLWSWYDPIHRLESAEKLPIWGRVLDYLLGPVDDDVKQKYKESLRLQSQNKKSGEK